MEKELTIGAVLMASGAGKRFGGDKLFAKAGESSLIERALQAIPADEFDRVLVVSADERILTLAEEYRFTPVRNDAPEEGISRSIRLGTERLKDLDAAMFFVCDQPNLTTETIRKLIRAAEKEPDCFIIPEAEGKWGNPCVFPKDSYPELAGLRGDTGGKAVIRRHTDRIRTVTVPEKELLDIDKKEDLPDQQAKF